MAKESNRRDGKDEKIQLSCQETIYKEIRKEFQELNLDLSEFTKISKSPNSARYFSANGNFEYYRNRKRNLCYDSKRVDSVAYFTNKNTNETITITTFCKFTKENGGQQDDIPFEVGVTNKNAIKNSNPNLILLFMLEGGYWTHDKIESAEFDNKKTFYVTRKTLKDTLIKILKNHKIIE